MTIEEVQAIARLARLHFSNQDMEAIKDTLNEVFDLVDQIAKIDTTEVPALAHPMEMEQRTRADEVTEQDQSEELHTLAPAVAERLYLVPKVID